MHSDMMIMVMAYDKIKAFFVDKKSLENDIFLMLLECVIQLHPPHPLPEYSANTKKVIMAVLDYIMSFFLGAEKKR